MRNLKKSLSLILALALLVSSVFVGGITASAATELYTTINTYDDEVTTELVSTTYDKQPAIQADSDYYYFGFYGADVKQNPLSDEADKVVYFDRSKGIYHSFPAAVRVYKENTNNFAQLTLSANKTYEVRLKYYSASTPSVPAILQLRVAHQRFANQTVKDEHILCPEIVTIVGSTDGWVEATAKFTTPATLSYNRAIITLSNSSVDTVYYDTKVYIDDVRVSECAPITAYNYDGENDKVVYTSEFTTLAELDMPTRDGYILTGIFSDAELTNTSKLNASDLALNYADTGVYYGWAKLNPGEYYAGFENYEQDVNDKSYDSATTSIVSGNIYAGAYNIKVDAPANSINAFELRDKEAFETKAGTKYVISFQYRSTAAAKLFAGEAKASDVPATATAIKGADLPAAADWTAASIEVTLNNGQKQGYVPALMVQTTDAAVVEFDHIYMTYPVEETINIEDKFVTSKDWYPSLALFDGITIPEASAVWDGTTVAPTDADGDEVYEIDSAEKLAYIVKNGGTIYQTVTSTDPETNEEVTTEEVVVENASYILTKDIYLNDISKYDWMSDAVAGSDIKAWYTTEYVKVGFNGTIDGNFHSVYGLYSKYIHSSWNANDYGRGLIPNVLSGQTATIKNLTVDFAHVDAETNAAAFVGNAQGGTVILDSCIAGENIYITGYHANALVSGMHDGIVTITNCASYATTEIENLASGENLDFACYGLVSGYFVTKATVVNSFNANGPIVGGYTGGVTAKYCYETEAGTVSGVTLLTKQQMQGKDVLKIEGTMPLLNVNGNYWLATDEYPVLSASRGVEVVDLDIWNGTYTTAPVDSDEDGVIEINTAEEFAYVIYNGGGADNSYILTKNIFLNNLDLINWATGETASGYTPNPWFKNRAFQGSIDGNGYTVYGMYYKNASATWDNMTSGYDGVGLIPRVDVETSVSITKLGVDYAYIWHKTSASPFIGIAGTRANDSFTNHAAIVLNECYVGSTVYVTAGAAGHFRGYTKGSSQELKNCYSLGKVVDKMSKPASSTDYTTSYFFPNSWSSKLVGINNCYSGTANFTVNFGTWNETNALVHYNYSIKGTHSTSRTAENMQGLDALTNSSKMPNLIKDYANNNAATTYYTATESYPVLTAFVGKFYEKSAVDKDDAVTEDGEVNYEYWDGSKPYEVKSSGNIVNADSYAKVKAVLAQTGDGTEEKPYKITNGTDLYAVMAYGGEAGAYYQLQNDIYLNDLSKINWRTGSVANGYKLNTWRPNVAFAGNIDGNGHTIYGLYYHDGKTDYGTAKSYACGLISKVASGTVTVKDLGIDNCYFRYDSNSGAFIGSVYDGATATMSNCYAGQNVTLVGNYPGLVGFAQDANTSVSLDRCYSLATLNANGNYSGLIGRVASTTTVINLNSCYNGNGKLMSGETTKATATNCYESADGPLNTGVTTISADSMKGKDVLTSSAKMAGLRMARAYIETKADFSTVNYNNFVYLPAGTTLEEDFAPVFFDTRMAPLAADDVMFVDRMIRGAYVKFEKEVDVTKIHVPVSKAHRVAFGTAQDLLASGYYDIETEMISENLEVQGEAVNYIFITDPHFDTGSAIYSGNSAKQFALAIQMANENEEIDFVCLGGDLTNGGYSTSEGWIDGYYDSYNKYHKGINQYLAAIKECTKPVFVLVGNHDDNAYSTFNAAKVVSPDQWQETIIDQFVNRELADGTVIDVVQDVDPLNSEKVNSKYYYYDLDAKNTRIICLNASDFPYEYDENGNFTLKVKNASKSGYEKYYSGRTFWGYSDHQMKWLAEEALGTIPEDYNVIVLSHMAITTNGAGDESYANGNVLSDIMQAYQTKTTYTNEDIGMTEAVDFTTDTGRIMVYQHGHEHYVYEKYNAGPQVWQFSSSTPNPHSGGLGGRIFNENAASIDVMSVTEGYVYKQAQGHGDSGMFINKFPVYESDVNLDTKVDICDLVKFDNLELAALPAVPAANTTLEKLRKLLIGA